jgi:hypothetical protein
MPVIPYDVGDGFESRLNPTSWCFQTAKALEKSKAFLVEKYMIKHYMYISFTV